MNSDHGTSRRAKAPPLEGLLQAIVAGSEDAIIAKDLEGVIISWNPAAERMFGYTAEEAIGQHVSMLIPDDHRGEDQVVMQRLLSGANVEHYDTERVGKDGVRRHVSLTVSPIKDADGTIVGCSKIMRDIAGARDAARVQAQVAAIVESTDDAIITKDATGRVTSWNRAAERMFGYTAEEMEGQHISMLFPPDLIGHERDILGEIMAGKKVDHYETRRIARDGHVLDVSLTVSPLRDADGTIIGASKIVRDVSERKRIEAQERHAAELKLANERLAAADRLKDEFLAMANHELRTPLTSIMGFTRTMIDLGDALTEERKQEFLEIVDSQANRLSRMVDDMLTLSRIELGKLDARPTELNVLEQARLALRQIGRDQVQVRMLGDTEPCANVDPHHFQQMLLNYVDNAFKYGATPVEVQAEAQVDSVVIKVCDNGRGVPREFEPLLFDRFSRAPRDSESEVPGTGLGLSIVRGLARAQGGEAWHERNEPHGSCFCLRLPRLA